MEDRPELRISDAERQPIISRLQAAYAEGRITDGELDERLERTYGARTAGDLEALVSDLPAAAPPPAPPVRRAGAALAFAKPLMIAPIICTVIWLMTTPTGYFWPMWVWFGCLVPALTAWWAAGGLGGRSSD